MKMIVQGVPVFDETFASTEAIVDRYREEELQKGREVPRYSWEALLAAVGGWLLKKAADELWKWAVEYRKRRKEHEDKEAAENAEERRHRELLERLDKIIAGQGANPPADIDWFKSLVARGDVVLQIEFSNDVERDFRPAFEARLKGAGKSLVIDPD
jgi:hypothetical protein